MFHLATSHCTNDLLSGIGSVRFIFSSNNIISILTKQKPETNNNNASKKISEPKISNNAINKKIWVWGDVQHLVSERHKYYGLVDNDDYVNYNNISNQLKE